MRLSPSLSPVSPLQAAFGCCPPFRWRTRRVALSVSRFPPSPRRFPLPPNRPAPPKPKRFRFRFRFRRRRSPPFSLPAPPEARRRRFVSTSPPPRFVASSAPSRAPLFSPRPPRSPRRRRRRRLRRPRRARQAHPSPRPRATPAPERRRRTSGTCRLVRTFRRCLVTHLLWQSTRHLGSRGCPNQRKDRSRPARVVQERRRLRGLRPGLPRHP